MCSQGTFSLEIGATKNRIELGESLAKLGWETTLVSNEVLGIPPKEKYEAEKYSLALRDYLIANSGQFDVVLYEYDTLPFERSLFSPNTLFVARPALLDYHFLSVRFKFNLKTKISSLYRKFKNWLNGKTKDAAAFYAKIDYCLSQCDLIQVQNSKDRQLLLDRGFHKDEIIIIPNGISVKRLSHFQSHVQKNWDEPFTLACVGTFDFRKGAMDFSYLFNEVKKRFPDSRLKLLGTKGLFNTQKQVLQFFPAKHRSSIEVIPKFKADELPGLLKDCQVGVFPSYLESFGFGALEMMCAGLPVVAYDAPGPCDFILKDLLVTTGDEVALTHQVLALLEDPELMEKKGRAAKDAVMEHYSWDFIAKQADEKYHFHLKKRMEVSK